MNMKNKKIVFAGLVVSAFVAVVLSANSANADFWNWFKTGDDNVAAVGSAATTTPTIKVVSPNGGEVWKAGTKKNIVFKGNLIKEPVDISLLWNTRLNSMSVGKSITSGNGKTSTYPWIIPTTLEERSDYEILISYKGREEGDGSDKTFTIKSAFSSSSKSSSSKSRSSSSSATTTKNYLLKIIKSGEGSVTDEQRQIVCGTGCKRDSGSYIAGSEVKLTAAPNGGYVFEKFTPEKECSSVYSGPYGFNDDKLTKQAFAYGPGENVVCVTIMNKNKGIAAHFKKISKSSSSSRSKSSSSR